MKVDLHVHSKFSKRPSQWILQKIGCPESFTEPMHLRDIAIRKGMSMVTITDHNTIEGILEIAHLPDTFISEEVTTYFPENGCKIHVLVYNINERQHQDIQKARENIYDFVGYLRGEHVIHAVAHALYSVNDLLTADLFEKLILLFKTFEINGSRDEKQNEALRWILTNLSQEEIDGFADRHGIDPSLELPWRKDFVGGSDDHSSLNIARTCTQVDGAGDLQAFLTGIESGESRPLGRASTPVTLSHNLYGIAYQFYKHKFRLEKYVDRDIFFRFLDRSLQNKNNEASVRSRFYFLVQQYQRPKAAEGLSIQGALRQEAHNLICEHPEMLKVAKSGNGNGTDMGKKWFEFVDRVSNRVLGQFCDHLMNHLSGANLFDIFTTLGSAGSLYTMLAPYFVSYALFAEERAFTRDMVVRFSSGGERTHGKQGSTSIAHFTDTFYEINGVALTLKQQATLAGKVGTELKIITCDGESATHAGNIITFRPVATYELPEYPEQKLFCPPFLEMLNYCYDQAFTHIHSATPGPIGLAALGIARILKLPISGTYHTALPQYARYLTNDADMEELMWKYVLWYYAQMDLVFVPSESTRAELVDKGVPPHKVRTFPRGVDTERFHPSKRDPEFLRRYVADDGLKILYVGRVSKEKDLPLLVKAFKAICIQRNNVNLIVTGDGPYLTAMQEELKDVPAHFTGYLEGRDLDTLYATCDLFVFPSGTDTFGNVVLEAQASGLPVIVTDMGGPRENIVEGETGLVVPARDPDALKEAILALLNDPGRMREMGRRARQYIEGRSFESAFRETSRMYQDGPFFLRRPLNLRDAA
jgi:glycosyltransferase involved in cell wall biosynthesis